MKNQQLYKNMLIKFSFLSILLPVLCVNEASASEMVRFDFQHHHGEGDYSLFRVEVDMDLKRGKACFFDTEWAGVRAKNIDRLYNGELC